MLKKWTCILYCTSWISFLSQFNVTFIIIQESTVQQSLNLALHQYFHETIIEVFLFTVLIVVQCNVKVQTLASPRNVLEGEVLHTTLIKNVEESMREKVPKDIPEYTISIIDVFEQVCEPSDKKCLREVHKSVILEPSITTLLHKLYESRQWRPPDDGDILHPE